MSVRRRQSGSSGGAGRVARVAESFAVQRRRPEVEASETVSEAKSMISGGSHTTLSGSRAESVAGTGSAEARWRAGQVSMRRM